MPLDGCLPHSAALAAVARAREATDAAQRGLHEAAEVRALGLQRVWQDLTRVGPCRFRQQKVRLAIQTEHEVGCAIRWYNLEPAGLRHSHAVAIGHLDRLWRLGCAGTLRRRKQSGRGARSRAPLYRASSSVARLAAARRLQAVGGAEGEQEATQQACRGDRAACN